MTTTAAISNDWSAWRVRSLRAAVLFDDYVTTGDWDAINDAYSEAWWSALTPAERWAERVAMAYQDVLYACQEAEIARTLAAYPDLVAEQRRLAGQFERQTMPGGMAAAKAVNQRVDALKEVARQRAREALAAAIRRY